MARHHAAPSPRVLRRLLRALVRRRDRRAARHGRASRGAGADAQRRLRAGRCRRRSTCSTAVAHEAAARVIPLAALLTSLPAHYTDPRRGVAGGPRRVHRPLTRQQTLPASLEAGACGCCTRTATWSPSPSRARAMRRRICRHFLHPGAWYWTKITRLGLTHCGGLGAPHRFRRSWLQRSAGPHAEVSIRGTQ